MSTAQSKAILLRQTGITTHYGTHEEVRAIYIEAVREIDEGYVQRRNHIVAVMRYSETDELLEGYCRLGAL